MGLVMVTFSYFFQLADGPPRHVDPLDYLSGFSLNIGTEFLGSLLIFVLLGLASKSANRNTGKRYLITLVMLGITLLAYAIIIATSQASGFDGFPSQASRFDVFLGQAALNMFSEVAGSLIIFSVLDNVLKAMEERQQRVQELIKKIDSFSERPEAAA